MKIDFLEIINFRNMRSAALDFANRNFVALIGDNGSGKTTILESITKAFVPVLRAVNGEAVKQCDLSNTDIKEGTSSVAVTLGIDLEGAKYTWTNKRRKASIFPYDEAIEIRGQNGNDLKKIKTKIYRMCYSRISAISSLLWNRQDYKRGSKTWTYQEF